MAAILKKRALAAYSQSQSQVVTPEPIPKRLKLIKKRQPSGFVDQVKGDHSTILESEIHALETGGASPADTFRLLSNIASSLPASVSTQWTCFGVLAGF